MGQPHPDSFPPVVINISDGGATDGELRADLAGQLRGLKTLDGDLLFFNVNISARPGSPLLFPSNAAQLPPNDEYAATLYEMSSRLTPDQLKEAVRFGATEGARGFAFNTNILALRQFLRIGTMVRTVDDRRREASPSFSRRRPTGHPSCRPRTGAVCASMGTRAAPD